MRPPTRETTAASSHCPNRSRRPGGASHRHGLLLEGQTVDLSQRKRRGSKKRPSQIGGLKENNHEADARVGGPSTGIVCSSKARVNDFSSRSRLPISPNSCPGMTS